MLNVKFTSIKYTFIYMQESDKCVFKVSILFHLAKLGVSRPKLQSSIIEKVVYIVNYF